MGVWGDIDDGFFYGLWINSRFQIGIDLKLGIGGCAYGMQSYSYIFGVNLSFYLNDNLLYKKCRPRLLFVL